MECLYCHRDSQEVPLVLLLFHNQQLAICPQHLPILIHKPEQLTNILDNFSDTLSQEE